jgi:hypothetical protein
MAEDSSTRSNHNPEGHSPRYWRKHPEATPQAKPHTTEKRDDVRLQDKKSLRGWWEAGVVIIGIIGTIEVTAVLPRLYWPCVVLVYIGLGLTVVDGFRGKWHSNIAWRIVVCVLGVCALLWWTFEVVFVKANIVADSSFNLGDYPNETKIGDRHWDNSLEDLRINLTNTSDYDFLNMNFAVSSDMMMKDIFQMEQVCQGFQAFVGEHPPKIELKDGTGNVGVAPMVGPSIATKMRVRCELPAHSTVAMIVALMPTNIFNGQWPAVFGGGKRKPKSCIVNGTYRAMGKTRTFEFNCKPD